MLVTEVEMLLWHADTDIMVKMMWWLGRHEKFLFDNGQRVAFGLLVGIGQWDAGEVRIDRRCWNNVYIDL